MWERTDANTRASAWDSPAGPSPPCSTPGPFFYPSPRRSSPRLRDTDTRVDLGHPEFEGWRPRVPRPFAVLSCMSCETSRPRENSMPAHQPPRRRTFVFPDSETGLLQLGVLVDPYYRTYSLSWATSPKQLHRETCWYVFVSRDCV